VAGGMVDGGGHAGEVRVVQPSDGVLHADGDCLAQADGQLQQATLGPEHGSRPTSSAPMASVEATAAITLVRSLMPTPVVIKARKSSRSDQQVAMSSSQAASAVQ
jgi:hypothetical protein